MTVKVFYTCDHCGAKADDPPGPQSAVSLMITVMQDSVETKHYCGKDCLFDSLLGERRNRIYGA